MALTLAANPELTGLKAFLDKCECTPENFDADTKCFKVTVAGVSLRITENKEYVVEQDLNPGRKKLTMEKKKLITAAAYRVRAAYSTTRVESQVGSKRLTVYRELRKDPEAAVFFARSRAKGGKTPPPVMALSIMQYYVHDIGAEELGLDKFPEFMTLLQGIELLPGCDLGETLRGKHQRRQKDEGDQEVDEVSEEQDTEPTIESLTKEIKRLKAQNLELKFKLKGHVGTSNTKYGKHLVKLVQALQENHEVMKTQLESLMSPRVTVTPPPGEAEVEVEAKTA